jgi:hypothetical protein
VHGLVARIAALACELHKNTKQFEWTSPLPPACMPHALPSASDLLPAETHALVLWMGPRLGSKQPQSSSLPVRCGNARVKYLPDLLDAGPVRHHSEHCRSTGGAAGQAEVHPAGTATRRCDQRRPRIALRGWMADGYRSIVTNWTFQCGATPSRGWLGGTRNCSTTSSWRSITLTSL